MTAIILYIIALFFLGIGSAVVTYHMLRYRDPDDATGFVLVTYYALVLAILIATVLLLDYNSLFN